MSIDLGTAGNPLQLNAGNIIDNLLNIQAMLNDQPVPDDDRYSLIPPWVADIEGRTLLKRAQNCINAAQYLALKPLIAANKEWKRQIQRCVRNGSVGEISGFKFYVSNNLEVSE